MLAGRQPQPHGCRSLLGIHATSGRPSRASHQRTSFTLLSQGIRQQQRSRAAEATAAACSASCCASDAAAGSSASRTNAAHCCWRCCPRSAVSMAVPCLTGSQRGEERSHPAQLAGEALLHRHSTEALRSGQGALCSRHLHPPLRQHAEGPPQEGNSLLPFVEEVAGAEEAGTGAAAHPRLSAGLVCTAAIRWRRSPSVWTPRQAPPAPGSQEQRSACQTPAPPSATGSWIGGLRQSGIARWLPGGSGWAPGSR